MRTWRLLIYSCVKCVGPAQADHQSAEIVKWGWIGWMMNGSPATTDGQTEKKTMEQKKEDFWFAIIKTVMNGWRWSKEEVKPQFQMGFLVICHYLWLKKNPVAAQRTQKNRICRLYQRTDERKVALLFALFFVFLSPKCWHYHAKMDSVDQSQQHGTLIYFVILCRQNVQPLGQQLTCTHYHSPQSSFMFFHPPRHTGEIQLSATMSSANPPLMIGKLW